MSQSEELDIPITSLKSKKYIPKSFGPVARNCYPRHTLGGTYDKDWNDNIRPFLPEYFDELYYQCAPLDQQTKHLKGGEEVVLVGIVPQGKISFNLPKEFVPMQAILNSGGRHNLNPVIDTLIIEPDEGRLIMVWRARMMDKFFLPLERL